MSGNSKTEVMEELRKLGSASYKTLLMRNHGVKEPCFGVKIGDLKKIQKRIKKDYQLALELYATGNYDAMYLAGLIADDERMTKRDLERWASEAPAGGAVSGYTVPWVAASGPHGWELGLKWIDSPKAQIASTGWNTLLGWVARKEDSELDLKAIEALIARVLKETHKASNAVRYAMNSFIIAVGAHVKPLSSLALQAAEQIGPVTVDMGDNDCKVPYAPDYIRKIEKRGGIGKKRKSLKC